MAAGTAVTALVIAFAGEAKGACVAKDADRRSLSTVTAPKALLAPDAAIASGTNDAHRSIVGLWNVTFLFGNGPDVYDQGFQQWHADNTELMVDNAVSPAFGNVCVGVWKEVGPRTFRLKHMTFNWNADGTPAGTFILTMTVRLDRRGNTYAGEYEADSFDLAGVVIPDLHAEGTVRGVRISVH